MQTMNDLTKLNDVLSQLKDTTNQLSQLKKQIDNLMKHNEIAISSVERLLNEKKEQVADRKTGSKGEIDQNSPALKTINKLWRDNGGGLLVIKKPTWTPDYCLLVSSIEGGYAKGIAYRMNPDGKIEAYKKYTSINAYDAQYRLLQGDEEKLKRAVMALNGGKASNTPATDKRKAKAISNGASGKQAKVGCVVSILCCESSEEMQLEIVSSYDDVRYTTMGYKTKNMLN